MLDARIASSLNKITQNSYLKKKVSLEELKAQKENRFLRGRQIAIMFYDYFRGTGAHDTILDDADLFTSTLRNDGVQEFDTRWDEILLSMSKIPTDDVLESLYKLRRRESDQLTTVFELYELEIHQKISKPDYHKMKIMVKRNMDQKLRSENCVARNGRIETGVVVKNRRSQSIVERGLGECWQWQASGQCSKGHNRSFRHDERKREKSPPKSSQSSEPLKERDERKRSRRRIPRGRRPSGDDLEVDAPLHLAAIGIHPNVTTTKQDRDVNWAISVLLCTIVLRNGRARSLK